MGTPPSLCQPAGGWLEQGFYAPPGGTGQLEVPSSGRTGHLEVVPGISKCALLSALKPSTASANASVVVPHVTLATAALVVARVADKLCRCSVVQLERGIPQHIPAAAMLLTSSLPMPPLLPPSPALPHVFLLRSLLRVQLLALPQWLMRMAIV